MWLAHQRGPRAMSANGGGERGSTRTPMRAATTVTINLATAIATTAGADVRAAGATTVLVTVVCSVP